MSDIAIKFENISKQYRLGLVSTQTLSHDLNRWWQTSILRKEDPYLKIGETNDRTKKGENEYVWALQNINFEIKKGDVLGIIGKNGAGKSTLLKILSRVTSPTTGAIKAKGRIASLLEVGTGFHPELTGRENIYMNGCIMGMSRSEINQKLDEIVEFAGVARYIDTPTKRYSSGMTVRLGFSIAAHLEPEILVVDEVLAVGDAEFQKKAVGKMQDISKGEGRTVLFVSHNMGAVRRLCNTGILLKEGTIDFTGSVEDVIDRYVNIDADNTNYISKFTPDLSLPIYMSEIKVFTEGKKGTQTFDINDEIKIGLKYTVQEDIRATNFSFTLFRDGILLFRTWDIDLSPEFFELRKKGIYEMEFSLPSFLMPGNYSINISCGRPKMGIIQLFEDCLSFTIENVTIDGNHQSFSRGGLVFTRIKWNLK